MNFYTLAQEIARIPSGSRYQVTVRALQDLGVTPERIMDNIVGSAYTFRFFLDQAQESVIFERLTEPTDGNRLTYVAEDRRAWYRQDKTGFYVRKF